MSDKLQYRDGYVYQTAAPYFYQLPLSMCPPVAIDAEFYALSVTGHLTIKSGYAWDGATNCPDVPAIIRGSAVHDCLYALMREGHLPHSCRDGADRVLEACCLEDGMSPELAELVYHAVRLFGDSAADPSTERPTLFAPPDAPAPAYTEREAP